MTRPTANSGRTPTPWARTRSKPPFAWPTPAPGQRRRAASPGFTLVELLTVLVILAIMAGVAVPSLNSMPDTRSSMAARKLLRDMSFARQRAVATGTRSWVVINAGTETWSVLAEDPLSPGRAGAAVITDMGTGEAYTFVVPGTYAGIGITSAAFDGNTEVGFDWLGKPLNSAQAALSANGTVVFSGGDQVLVYARTGHMITFDP